MKHLDKNNPATLSEWLEIATRGLAVPGKERITREIEAHYAEAVQACRAQGEPSQTVEAGVIAESRVIEELGDPDIAAKHFREIHLTEKEAENIANLRNGAGKTSMLLLWYVSPVILLCTALLIGYPKPHLIFDAIILTLTICPTVSCLIAKLGAIKARVPLLLLMDCVRDIAFAFAVPLILLSELRSSGLVLAFWIIALSQLVQIVPKFRTWNKARKLINVFDETTGIAS
jgi:uncharacterized membrane protein